MKQCLLALVLAALLVGGGAVGTLAQGDDPVEDFKIDWCVIVNGQAALSENEALAVFAPLLAEQFPEPGYYEVTIPVLEGEINFDDLRELTPEDLQNLPIGERTLIIYIEDRGVDCTTGDPHGVVRLWDDKMTMVIYRNANYDLAFYRVNGRHIHTTPFWMLVGPFEAGQLVDEHETIGGTLRLYYLEADWFQVNWYGPDGTLALQIPFTYPQPCVDGPPGAPRVCQAGRP